MDLGPNKALKTHQPPLHPPMKWRIREEMKVTVTMVDSFEVV
jgi:hypothetical protein